MSDYEDEERPPEVYLELRPDDTLAAVSDMPTKGYVVGHVPESPDAIAIARKLETLKVTPDNANMATDVMYVEWRDVDKAKPGEKIRGVPMGVFGTRA